jgi:selenide,water dikinase
MRTLNGGAAAAPQIEYHLFTNSPDVLPAYNRRVRRWFDGVLAERGIRIHTGRKVVAVSSGHLHTEDGQSHAADEILWTTEAAAPSWPAASGLAVDEGGFIRVSRSLQSTSHAEIFAAGDVAAMVEDPRPKSGVVAVRQGPPLARNLRQCLLGRPLEAFRPQRRFLSLISTGDKYAIASRGAFACRGAWIWQWKDWIDRRFIRTYNQASRSTGTDGGSART